MNYGSSTYHEYSWQDPDDEPEEIVWRTECTECGADLPKEPEMEAYVEEWREPKPGDEDFSEIFPGGWPVARAATREEIERRDPKLEWTDPIWRCACGASYGLEEMQVEETGAEP